tara:strand:- start:1886 stop:3091 length:1206 start_codon:yes stop_codon:yes gene_type:complete
MAVGPSNKGSGKLKRTTIDPRIGGTKGDAGFAGKAGSKGPGTLGGSRGRTTIDPRIGGQKGDAGFSGKAKQLSGFGKAFSIALAKGPGTLFTYQGKKYKAIKKHEGKGPSASRVEDKVSKATMVKGKRDTTNTKDSSLTAAVKKVKAKAPTPASGRFGQRKAGGMMKAKDGDIAGSTAVYTRAKKQAGEDKVTLTDLREAASVLGYKLAKEKRNSGAGKMTVTDVKNAKKLVGKRKGGVMKARFGKLALDLISKKASKDLGNYTKREVAELTKMTPQKQGEFMKLLDESKLKKRLIQKRKSSKKKIAAVGTIGFGAMLLDKKKKTTKPKRKEDKVSQADIIGKGSKTGRRAGGMMKAKNGGFPDLSGDGKITKKDILMGRGVIKKRGGGAAIKGMNFKGVL